MQTPMQTPQSLDDAMAMLKAEQAKLSTGYHTLIGSRWLMAILATCCMAFGLHAVYAPTRLPRLTGVSLTAWGLPNGADLNDLSAVGQKLHEGAANPLVQPTLAHGISLLDQYAPAFNIAGFGLCLGLLLLNMTIMTKRRSFTRG